MVHDPRSRTADDVEFQVMNNLRGLGKDLLTSWAAKQVDVETTRALEQDSQLKRSKKSTELADNIRTNYYYRSDSNR